MPVARPSTTPRGRTPYYGKPQVRRAGAWFLALVPDRPALDACAGCLLPPPQNQTCRHHTHLLHANMYPIIFNWSTPSPFSPNESFSPSFRFRCRSRCF